MSQVPLSTILGNAEEPRRKIYTFTSSNASIAIPSWAQGGKGIVLVSGCGGGASGAVYASTSGRGEGGGGGAVAMKHPMLIPSGTSSIAVTIGAGGAAVVATVGTAPNVGGNTTITVGSQTLTLQGGGNRTGLTNSRRWLGGYPFVGSVLYGDTNGLSNTAGAADGSYGYSGWASGASTLSVGASGGVNTQNGGYGAGATSPFGAGGAGLAASPSVTTNGESATGYGAGGAGALTVSSATATSGAGSPGIVILEFVEGF